MPEITYSSIREYAEANDKLLLELLDKYYIECLLIHKTFIREPDEIIKDKLAKLEKAASKIKGSKTSNEDWTKLRDQLVSYTVLKGNVAAESHKSNAFVSLANQLYFVNLTKGANVKVDFYADESKTKVIATGEITAIVKNLEFSVVKVKEKFPDMGGVPKAKVEREKPKKKDMYGGADGKLNRFEMFNEITRMYKNDTAAYVTSTLMNFLSKNAPSIYKTTSALLTGCPEVDCYVLTDPYARESALDVTRAECSYLIPDTVLSQWYDGVQADQDYSKIFNSHMKNMNSNKSINKSAINAYRSYLGQKPKEPRFSNAANVETDKIVSFNDASYKYLNEFYDSIAKSNVIPGTSEQMFNSNIFGSLQETFDTKSLKNTLVWRDSLFAIYNNNKSADFESWNNVVQTSIPGMYKDAEVLNNVARNKDDISHISLGVQSGMLPFMRVDYNGAVESLKESNQVYKFTSTHFEYRPDSINKQNYPVFAHKMNNNYVQLESDMEEDIVEPELPLDDVTMQSEVKTNSRKVEISLDSKPEEEIEF